MSHLTADRQGLSALPFNDRAAVILRSIGDAVISTDANCVVDYMNPVAEQLTGWLASQALGLHVDQLLQIVNEHTRVPLENPLLRSLIHDQTVGLPPDTVMVNRQGKDVAIEDTASPIRDNNGQVTGAVMVFHDVSEQRRLQREIAYQSSHDLLTGLVNKREFEAQLHHAIETVRTAQASHVVCYLDLDQFKIVNDTSGHAAGDELLRQVTALMRENVRQNDVLARLGGDEFGVLLCNCRLDQALQVAENLRSAVEEFRFSWHPYTFKVGVSVGVVPLVFDAGSVSDIMQAADSACYAAKEGGRNRVHLFVRHDIATLRTNGEINRIAHLANDLAQGHFRLYAQEIAPLQDNSNGLSNIEILLRLKGTDGGIIEPNGFMPAAERYHRASTIDRWVIKQTLDWLADHSHFSHQIGHIAINLSGQSLCDATFQRFLTTTLSHYAFAKNKVCFEITETAAIANLSRANTFMHTLREQGCLLALDDFGSGLSSFGYLRNLPVDILKIDGMFVRGIVNDSVDEAMVKAINQVGHLMGKETVAECVENKATLNLCQQLGVNYAQGFTLGYPKPLADFV
jgi:diguanylate cyclase (GGDEF)-like protein/PAS domain S-box-containing protein